MPRMEIPTIASTTISKILCTNALWRDAPEPNESAHPHRAAHHRYTRGTRVHHLATRPKRGHRRTIGMMKRARMIVLPLDDLEELVSSMESGVD